LDSGRVVGPVRFAAHHQLIDVPEYSLSQFAGSRRMIERNVIGNGL
jgi:hypothetical protein